MLFKNSLEMIRIRKANEADYPTVIGLVERAFRNVHDSGHLSLTELRDSEFFMPELSIVAEIDGHKIVGYILLIKVSINGTPSLGLAQVAVAPEYQELGIGTLLLNQAHQKARELGYGSVISLGCKRFLSKFGYHIVADFGIHFPYGVVQDQCLALELYPGALDEVQGLVGFPLEYM